MQRTGTQHSFELTAHLSRSKAVSTINLCDGKSVGHDSSVYSDIAAEDVVTKSEKVRGVSVTPADRGERLGP